MCRYLSCHAAGDKGGLLSTKTTTQTWKKYGAYPTWLFTVFAIMETALPSQGFLIRT